MHSHDRASSNCPIPRSSTESDDCPTDSSGGRRDIPSMRNSESTKWSGRAARRLIAVLLLVAPLEQLGFDIYTPALPKIAAHFAASNALVQNTVTAYMLGMALVVLPAGLIADAVGRKR